MTTGFFFKQEKKAVTKREPKVKPVHELPPVLKIKVPAAKKKEKKEKKTSSDKSQLNMDIECYVNYFLVKFKRDDGTYVVFELVDELSTTLDRDGIRELINTHEIVTFNGNHYDVTMLNYALHHKDCTNKELKKISDELIKSEVPSYKLEEKYKLPELAIDHVDLSPLSPVGVSLKLCGARLSCDKLQELPYEEASILSESQMNDVNEYCSNDLDIVSLMKKDMSEELELRRVLSERYDVNLMSKSDAQIAEEIIKAEVLSRTGFQVKRPKEVRTVQFTYQVPDFISFTNPKLNDVLELLRNNPFTARPVNSGISMPEQLEDLEIQIGKTTYRMGIGGLHSSEKTMFCVSDDEYDYWDWDVTSFYPYIMLVCGLYPKSIGEKFLEIFRVIVEERIAAKNAGDKVKADSMKITINGTFGKTGSPWSILYAPDLMIQVTITGQLSLLMLIDSFDQNGFDVMSGNTDGIVVKCPRGREKAMKTVIERWQRKTGFGMESARYAGLYSRDVNNYIAIGYDGKTKTKGCFEYANRKKNPEYDVCTDALVEYFKNGTPVEDTIQACKDIDKFMSVRRVNGGAVKDGEYLGKVVRWYYSKDEKGTINYKTNGNKVPKSDGARALSILSDKFPDDIDYAWYVEKCKSMFH